MRGLGDLHHPIATASSEAQRLFDQGLRFVYAFNHDEAVRSFTRAAELDPKAPMPMSGIALALGPNINLDVDPAREQAAYAATLDARLAAADDDGEAAIGAWRVAVERADALAYDEPPAWYYPVRESRGAALHAAGRPAEAEAVFREDLRRHPRNPRSIFGLRAALRAQGKVVAGDAVDREFRVAWTTADVHPTLRDF